MKKYFLNFISLFILIRMVFPFSAVSGNVLKQFSTLQDRPFVVSEIMGSINENEIIPIQEEFENLDAGKTEDVNDNFPGTQNPNLDQPNQLNTSQQGQIAFIRDGNIWLINADGFNLTQLTSSGNYKEVSWSPDGKKLAFIHVGIDPSTQRSADEVGVYDISTNLEYIVVPPEKTGTILDIYYVYSNPRWSKDNDTIYFIKNDGRVQGRIVHTVNINTLEQNVGFENFFSVRFNVSPLDDRIVYVDFTNVDPTGHNLNLASADGLERYPLFPILEGVGIQGVTWNQDAKSIIFSAHGGEFGEGSIVKILPDATIQETWLADSAGSITISPDSSHIAYENYNDIYLLNLANGERNFLVTGTSPSWNPIPGPPDSDYLLKLLFVPLNWQSSQENFDSFAKTQSNLFINEIPLANCREKIKIEMLDVHNQNLINFKGSTREIRNFIKDDLLINIADWDVIIGLVEESPYPRIMGRSNTVDTIWATIKYDIIIAHELGHIFDLSDQYCSNQAGSTDTRCNDGDIQNDGALTGDVNWLDSSLPCDCPPDGSNDSGGSACCNYNGYDCSSVDYGVCCLGNKNANGGRSIMSFANAPGPRNFDVHEIEYLSSLPELQCYQRSNASKDILSSTDTLSTEFIIDLNLIFQSDNNVKNDYIRIVKGRPTLNSILEGLSGDYVLTIYDIDREELINQPFNLYFDYSGPVEDGVDYSGISYDTQDISFRFQYTNSMDKLEVQHKGEIIYSIDLPRLYDSYLPLIIH